MAQRKRIGISYSYNKNWIGGTYYIENLISALTTLDDIDKPHLTVIANNRLDYKVLRSKFNYPYSNFQLGSGEKNDLLQLLNKVSGRLLGKRFFSQQITGLDAVFPYYPSVQHAAAKRKIYWIADFQEHFAPEFFSEAEIKGRIDSQLIIQASADQLILSSQNAFMHFKQIYPDYKVNVRVMPFAVTHPPYAHLNVKDLMEKYQLPAAYFICPNQFWKHKNQAVVLEAIKELKDKGISLTVAFTGNTQDYRNPEYFRGLQEYVEKHSLSDQIRFLGFIRRDEQLQLMKHSRAIIQPSLFEGWSTVVEDAKAMNKMLIVSDIAIHREQLLGSNAVFFEPRVHQTLARKMEKISLLVEADSLFETSHYAENVKAFGASFLEICS